MHETTGKNEIQNVFEWGHKRVLKSLVQFTNKSFDINILKAKSFSKSDLLTELEDLPFNENLTLLKTEIIGDIFGKSYWLIDEPASNYITNTDNNKQLDTNFSYEMLREVDNIISATLISQLSDNFSLKIYGDVPELVLPKLKPFKEIVNTDFQKSNSSLFIYALEFQIKEFPTATCLFFWCIEATKILQ